MILLTMAAMLATAAADTAASAQRSAFSKCLTEASAKALSEKVAVEAFDTLMRSHCSASEAKLREAVIAIDVRNGISRKDAAEGAKLETDDYFLSTGERYEAEWRAKQPL